RIFRGNFEIGLNRVGSRTFLGNSSMLPMGVDLGRDCLVGCLSVPPEAGAPDGTKCVGSPSFLLPRQEQVEKFDDVLLYTPSRSLYLQRLVVDAFRILIPGWIVVGALATFVLTLYHAFLHFPASSVVLISPVLGFCLSVAAFSCVMLVKKVLIGSFKPVVKPLWSRYVWFNEVVNGVWESVGAQFLAAFLGTPFAPILLRCMGCNVGRNTYIRTTLFSEFDLVKIGDGAALNIGATIQTHLFEDRIMKSSYLEIGE
ncbi:unnamed protein product, partial [marine sediment metagenome]